MLTVGVLKRRRIAFIILFLLCLLFIANVGIARADIIVVGKASDDGTLLLPYYIEKGNVYVVRDYETIGVDTIYLAIYSPLNCGKDINITLISYIPIINQSNGEEIGRRNYTEQNVTIHIPYRNTIITHTIALSSTNETEKIIIQYKDVKYIFFHKTKLEYIATELTIGELTQAILAHVALTGLVVATSIKTSKRILDKTKYFPKLSYWHVLVLAFILVSTYFALFYYAFEIYYKYQYIILYGLVYVIFLLLSLHTFTPFPKVWLLIHIPKQEPETRVFNVWIRYMAIDYRDDKIIRIRKDWGNFIARLFGIYEYVTVRGYAIPIKEISNSFDRVIFLNSVPKVQKIQINTLGIIKVILWSLAIVLAFSLIWLFIPAYGIIIAIATLIFTAILAKKGKLSELKQKIGSQIFTEGKTELECAHRDTIDMLNWLYEYVSTADIAKAKELNRQKYLELKAQFEVYTDKKAEAIFARYKKMRDQRFRTQIMPKEPRVIPKAPKTTPEGEVKEEKERENENESK